MTMIYTLENLRNWAAMARNVEPPIRLGVFGDPVEHSLSPQMQNAGLRESGLAMQYAAFSIRAEELAEALGSARQNNFIGLNLTVPHKIAAMELIDDCDDAARKIGAVNTVSFGQNEVHGSNTDCVGFSRAVREAFSVDLRDLRVLLLGAGGAAQAIAFQCAEEQCERLAIANRDFEKAAQLVEQLRLRFSGPRVLGPVARIEAVRFSDEALRFQIANSDLVVNATTLGQKSTDSPALTAHQLAPHLFVFDTIYGRQKTPLVRGAEEAGARACDGRLMLLHQGAAAFETWFDRPAPLETMRGALF